MKAARILLLLFLAAPVEAHVFNPEIVDVWERDGYRASTIDVKGATFTLTGTSEVVLRIHSLDGKVQTAVLTPDAPSLTLHETPPVSGYLRLGVAHILGGFDHLLFVLGLVLLVRRRLFVTLSAFTIAHSLTLALAMLGLVSVPQAPVEAAIALSILCLAVELLREGPSLTREKPYLVAFLFGLLHGLGFAGALGEIGLPQGQIAPALVCFNLGVELGQIAFVLALLAVGRLVRVNRRLPAYAIGSLAVFLCLDRLVS